VIFGWIWWWLVPVRKRTAIDNYRRAFPERDPRELRRTVHEIVAGYFELFLGRRAVVHGAELAEGGGLALAGHLGAWDLALVSGAEAYPITIFVKPPANPIAAWIVERLRRRAGAELLPPRDAMAAARAALERRRVVVFVQDQRHNQGMDAPFFGAPALTSAAFAAMAWRTKAPLLGIRQWKEGQVHHVRVERLDWPVPADRDEAIRVLTERSQQFYESAIRERPWSWLWLHDRWKHPARASPLSESARASGSPSASPSPTADDTAQAIGASAAKVPR
jgi:KDO2-lipid IV(A) lauroyltransferase